MNYQLELDNIIENIKDKDTPKLLLHSCCAPCSSYVLTYLMEYFDITVFYYNPNIYPESEFIKRKCEQEKIIDLLNRDEGIIYSLNDHEYHKNRIKEIKLVVPEYDHDEFLDVAKALADEKEGGARCRECFKLRLNKAERYASENGFDHFGTTLTVSPHKDAIVINKIGDELSRDGKTAYLISDFKKREGYKISTILSKELELYRQIYCGCEYSLRE